MRRLVAAAALVVLLLPAAAGAQGYAGGYDGPGYGPRPGYGDAATTEVPSINLITDSWRFSHTGALWQGLNAAFDITMFQTDPFSDAKAELFEAPVGGAAAAQEITVQFAGTMFAGYDDITVSLYLKYFSGTWTAGNMRFFNTTRGQFPRLNYHPQGGGPGVITFTSVSGEGGSGGISEDIGDGWYRLSFQVDLAGNRATYGWLDADNYQLVVVPFGVDSDADLGLYLFGYQVNPGTSVTSYVEKP